MVAACASGWPLNSMPKEGEKCIPFGIIHALNDVQNLLRSRHH
jgi:hypothetical protein